VPERRTRPTFLTSTIYASANTPVLPAAIKRDPPANHSLPHPHMLLASRRHTLLNLQLLHLQGHYLNPKYIHTEPCMQLSAPSPCKAPLCMQQQSAYHRRRGRRCMNAKGSQPVCIVGRPHPHNLVQTDSHVAM
jgi:hypothetical protein